ncbi:DUF2306 domain-containing protein [Arthrobacter sp. I2-34]|uniref:DUF2306 domain-containing protein n=1 Tax=Arthrobacter hankyongi TaxID=2904801 RepID=A0ABS9LCQ4_9MICC|nr:DUF2306 domain-containing protein [Arthrobacter hankyongi]MCG2624459.1 DUF2306 domain-containing protein [Arthrobacter hankyongi]
MTTTTVGAVPAARRPRGQWLAPAGLILLSLVPLIQGALRLGELTGGAPVTPDNARFFDSPIPVLVHIPSVTVYCLLGALQFVPSLRGRRGWHRIAGRLLVPAGLLAALTGLWMAAFYDLPPFDGQLMLILRLVFGSAMVASIVLGLVAVRRRDFARHGAWMARGYAIGLGAGTMVPVSAAWILLVGPAGELVRAVHMGAAWVINLAVAEYFIHRRSRAFARASGAAERSAAAQAGVAR